MKNILICLTFNVLFINCLRTAKDEMIIHEQIIKTKVSVVRENENLFLILLTATDTIKIISNGEKQNSMIKARDTLNLPFFITDPYLGNIYWYKFKNSLEGLIIESKIIGASGLSSDITNVTVVFFKTMVPYKVISFNSFYKGAELIEDDNLFIKINILNFAGYSADTPFYCLNKFYVDENFVLNRFDSIASCFIPRESGLEHYKNCEDCGKLNRPFVTN